MFSHTRDTGFLRQDSMTLYAEIVSATLPGIMGAGGCRKKKDPGSSAGVFMGV